MPVYVVAAVAVIGGIILGAGPEIAKSRFSSRIRTPVSARKVKLGRFFGKN